jgi:hypothetical protein
MFALKSFTPSNHHTTTKKGHVADAGYWATRSINGDTLGNEACGSDILESIEKWKKYHVLTEEGKKTPEFKRMLEFLRGRNITPRYYNEHGELFAITDKDCHYLVSA